MAQSLATEDEGVRQPCFTKNAEEPACLCRLKLLWAYKTSPDEIVNTYNRLIFMGISLSTYL
jgi:hypothetical protein